MAVLSRIDPATVQPILGYKGKSASQLQYEAQAEGKDVVSYVLDCRIKEFFTDEWKKSITECKEFTCKIADSLERIYSLQDLSEEERLKKEKLVYKVRHCGDRIGFFYHEGKKKMRTEGYFCDHRACPVCDWFRSRSLFGKIYHYVGEKEAQYLSEGKKAPTYVFYTLTVPNVPGYKLRDTVLKMNRAFGKMFKENNQGLSKYSQCFVGYYRKLEITFNMDPTKKSYRTFHPHIHVIFECREDYAPNTEHFYHYTEVLKNWRKYLEDESITEIKTKQIKNIDDVQLAKAVAEVSKYSFKYDKKLFYRNNEPLLDEFMYWIETLKGVRFTGASGTFRKMLHFVSKCDEHDTRELPHTPGVLFVRANWFHSRGSYDFTNGCVDSYGINVARFYEDCEMVSPDMLGARASPKA